VIVPKISAPEPVGTRGQFRFKEMASIHQALLLLLYEQAIYSLFMNFHDDMI
jgi:hypothetical protein